MTPGGLTELSTAGGPSRFRRLHIGMHAHETAKGRPCDERQARRDHSTSAAAFLLARTSAMRPPLPAHAALRVARRPLARPERAEFISGWRGGDKFLARFAEAVAWKRKNVAAKLSLSPLLANVPHMS